jgi:hypothetical protein
VPPPVVDPCCPPWNSGRLEDMLFYIGSGGIAAPYTLQFQPSSAFEAQIQAYINYLNVLNPAINTIIIPFRLNEAGNGSVPTGGSMVGQIHFVGWAAGGNGSPSIGPVNFFTLQNEPMQVNLWYRVHTGIYLNDREQFFPSQCNDNHVDVRIQVQHGPGAAHPVLQIRKPDGRIVEKALTPAATTGSRVAPAAPPPTSASPSLTPPTTELAPAEAAAPYGKVLAVSGDTAAVTGTVGGTAVVFVFVRSAGAWTEQARIFDPAPAATASAFGGALGLSGDTLAVGAGSLTAPIGSVYVYERSAGVWLLSTQLQPPRAVGLGFGTALALAGETLVVGAPGSAAGSASGAAYVYARDGAAWRRQAVLTAASPAPGDRFGRAVAAAHQHVLAGGSGFAEIFDLVSATWQRTAVLPGSGAGSGFGDSAAASDETLAVGDPASQRVSLFIHTGAGWLHQADIIPPDAQAGGFGSAISLSQDALLVGAPGSSHGETAASGAAYLFVRARHRWLLKGSFGRALSAGGEGFGGAVAVSLPTALVGSTGGSPVPTSAWLLEGLDNP